MKPASVGLPSGSRAAKTLPSAMAAFLMAASRMAAAFS
jgi:hypothetical protein